MKMIDQIIDRGMAAADLAEQYREEGNLAMAAEYRRRSDNLWAVLVTIKRRWPL